MKRLLDIIAWIVVACTGMLLVVIAAMGTWLVASKALGMPVTAWWPALRIVLGLAGIVGLVRWSFDRAILSEAPKK